MNTLLKLHIVTVHKWNCINHNKALVKDQPGSTCNPFQLGRRADAHPGSLNVLNLVIIFMNTQCIRNTTGIRLFSPGTIKGLAEYRQRLNLHGKLSMLGSIRRCCCAKFAANHVAKLEETSERKKIVNRIIKVILIIKLQYYKLYAIHHCHKEVLKKKPKIHMLHVL